MSETLGNFTWPGYLHQVLGIPEGVELEPVGWIVGITEEKALELKELLGDDFADHFHYTDDDFSSAAYAFWVNEVVEPAGTLETQRNDREVEE